MLSEYSSRDTSPSPPFAFANPISISPKSLLSPPSTTSSTLSLSPDAPAFAICSPSASCAYPSWPNRDVLSSTSLSLSNTSPFGKGNSSATSYISDADLLDLAELDLYDNSRIPAAMTAGIPWEATRQPPVVLQSSSAAQKVKAPERRRRRSSPLKKRRPVREMSVIVEAPE